MKIGRCHPLFPSGLIDSEIKRFWSNVDRSGSITSCWPWKGKTNDSGYGSFNSGGQLFAVHRLALYLHLGEDVAPLYTCHTCDNRICCNGYHLFGATASDNSRDAVMKGRTTTGSKNGMSRLTEDDVKKIRFLIAAGGTQAGLGKRSKSPDTISMIVTRKRWTHV